MKNLEINELNEKAINELKKRRSKRIEEYQLVFYFN